MKVIYYLLQIGLSVMQVNWLYFILKHGLEGLLPLINAFDAMDRQDSQMRNLFFKYFAKLGLDEFSTLKLLYGLINFLYASFSGLNRWYYFLNKGSLLWNIRKLIFDVFQNSHWVVFSIEHFCHELPWFMIFGTYDRQVLIFRTIKSSSHWMPCLWLLLYAISFYEDSVYCWLYLELNELLLF